MKSVIVPVFTDSDLAALPNCLRYLATQPTEILLVLHGPNVGVVTGDLTKEIDEQIAELDKKKRELSLVEDFDGAKRVKEQIDTLKVERDMKIRDGWKNIPETQRAEAYKKAFANIGTEAICLREAYTHDQVFSMLQAFLPQWPGDIAHGEYALIWPRSVPLAATNTQSTVINTSSGEGPTASEIVATSQVSRGFKGRSSREQELKSLHHLKVFRIAAYSNIPTKGMKTPDVIKAILDKEFPAELAAA